MNRHCITLQEALDQGSNAGTISAIANYHYRQSTQWGREMSNLTRQIGGRRPTGAQDTRMRELKAMKASSDHFVKHFSAMASAMRRIEKA